MSTRFSRRASVAAIASACLTPVAALATNVANIVGGQVVRMDYASDGMTVGGTYDYNVVGFTPGAGSVGFLNVVADLNNNSMIEPQEWVVQNIPMPLSPALTSYPMLSAWFDPGPFNLMPGQPYNSAITIENQPLINPMPQPSWHFSNTPTGQFNWGINDPMGQNIVPFIFTPPSLFGPLEFYKHNTGVAVPDIAQQRNECGPTSAANSLRWLAQTHGFNGQLPASNDNLIKDLMKAMTGSDMRPFGGLSGNQLFDGKKKYIADKKLPIVVKGGNGSAAASGAKAFDFIKQELKDGEDVEFLIDWPGTGTGSHWVTAIGYAVIGNRLFLEVNDPDDGKSGPVDWELRPDGTFVNPRGTMMWAVSESFSGIWDWIPPGNSGGWGLANWSMPGFPNGITDMAHFSGGGIVGGIGSVILDGDRTVNTVGFYNPTGTYHFVTSLGSVLTLNDGWGDGTIFQNAPSTNVIDLTVRSPGTLHVNLYDPAGALRIRRIDSQILRTDGPGSLFLETDFGATMPIVLAGAGLTQFNSRQHMTHLQVADGARVKMNNGGGNTLAVKSLGVAATGKLDLANNDAVIDYDVTSPLLAIKSLLVSGYNGGAWNGNGIMTSLGNSSQFALGYAEAGAVIPAFPATFSGELLLDSTNILIGYTRYGDADLNFVVNLNDFNALAANFGQSMRFWWQGDFNFNMLVNLDDFNLMAGNFGLVASPDGPTAQDWAALAAAVPEPSLALIAPLGLLVRRSRRTHPN